jgi:hypothetical protein
VTPEIPQLLRSIFVQLAAADGSSATGHTAVTKQMPGGAKSSYTST